MASQREIDLYEELFSNFSNMVVSTSLPYIIKIITVILFILGHNNIMMHLQHNIIIYI